MSKNALRNTNVGLPNWSFNYNLVGAKMSTGQPDIGTYSMISQWLKFWVADPKHSNPIPQTPKSQINPKTQTPALNDPILMSVVPFESRPRALQNGTAPPIIVGRHDTKTFIPKAAAADKKCEKTKFLIFLAKTL